MTHQPPQTRGDKPLPPLVPFGDSLAKARRQGELTAGEYALERARSLFHRQAVKRRYGSLADYEPHDATPVMRDLALRLSRLSGTERKEARQLLARPDDASDPSEHHYTVPSVSSCGTDACVHWVNSTEDAPPPADGNGNGTPDWVETTKSVVAEVWRKEVDEYGYRAPKSDLTSSNNGPDGKLDVYLADIGNDSLYGYCTSDDPNLNDPTYPYWDASAYCVIDEDFAEFPLPPRASLQVTVAHEFFHAVQFSYDAAEDLWMMEGTASWMEDEAYDGVNDNLQYLDTSPLAQPGVPVDKGATFNRYGNWIFWRYLSERLGAGAFVDDPSIVRDAWQRADGSPVGLDAYSMQALRQAVSSRGLSLPELFAHFGAVNHTAKTWYAEGASYRNAPVTTTHTLTSGTRSTGWRSPTLNHQANRNVAARAGASLTGSWRLQVSLDLPDRARGSQATVTVHRNDGTLSRRAVILGSGGNGTSTVPFSRSTVERVVVTTSNASSRYSCWQSSSYSCSGIPTDDGLLYSYRLSAIR